MAQFTKHIFVWILIYVHYINSSLTQSDTDRINGLKLGALLREFTDEALSASAIQWNVLFKDVYDRYARYSKSIPNQEKITQELAESIGSKFNELNEAVIRLKQALELDFKNESEELISRRCCDLTKEVLAMDDDFETYVDKQTICTRQKQPRLHDLPKCGKRFLQTAKENLSKNPFLKWQYMGMEDGGTIIYPAHYARCDYDPRNRPWYTTAASPERKDIVIVFSYTGQLDTIKHVINTIINTANSNDRIGVVRFGDKAKTHPGCFETKLALATATNKRELLEFVAKTKRSPGESTHYGEAIEKGFSLFGNCKYTNQRRVKVLIFMVERNPSDPSIEQIPETARAANCHQAVMVNYVIGEELNPETLDMMKIMAEETYHNCSDGLKSGFFMRLAKNVDDVQDLRYTLSRYYNIFSKTREQPIADPPYVDLWGLGLLVSICLPVHAGTPGNLKLLGVVCVDSIVSDLLFNITNFEHGKNTYAFIIDSGGRTFMHPNLHPARSKKLPLVWLDISMLEHEPELQAVTTSMKKGETKTMRFLLSRPRSKTTYPFKWIETEESIIHYSWTKVPGTDYRLCTVFTDSDREMSSSIVPDFPIHTDIYPEPCPNHGWTSSGCQTDLEREGACLLEDTIVLLNSSYVTLGPIAYRYAPTDEAVGEDVFNQADRLYYYFIQKDSESPPSGLKISVKPEVKLTSCVDSFWMDQRIRNYDHMVFWRFLVSLNGGVIRSYPGVKIAFRPHDMPWYNNAIAAVPGTLTFTLQRGSRSISLFISQVIFEGRISGHHFASDQSTAVLAAELNLKIIENMMYSLFTVCHDKSYRCFVVDESGVIIFHTTIDSTLPLFKRHIILQEHDISHFLATAGLLKNGSCLNWEQRKRILNYKIHLPAGIISKWSGKVQFEMHVVHGTNLIIGVAEEGQHSKMSDRPDFDSVSIQELNLAELPFDKCGYVYNRSQVNDRTAPCPLIVDESQCQLTWKQNISMVKLKQCQRPGCERFHSQSLCERYFCRWCSTGSYCSIDWNNCPPAVVQNSKSTLSILLPVVLIVCLILVVLMAIWYIKKIHGLLAKLFKKDTTAENPENNAVRPENGIPDAMNRTGREQPNSWDNQKEPDSSSENDVNAQYLTISETSYVDIDQKYKRSISSQTIPKVV